MKTKNNKFIFKLVLILCFMALSIAFLVSERNKPNDKLFQITFTLYRHESVIKIDLPEEDGNHNPITAYESGSYEIVDGKIQLRK